MILYTVGWSLVHPQYYPQVFSVGFLIGSVAHNISPKTLQLTYELARIDYSNLTTLTRTTQSCK